MKYIETKAIVYLAQIEIEKLLNMNIEITNKLLTQQTEILKEGLKQDNYFIRSSKQKYCKEHKK